MESLGNNDVYLVFMVRIWELFMSKDFREVRKRKREEMIINEKETRIF